MGEPPPADFGLTGPCGERDGGTDWAQGLGLWGRIACAVHPA